MRHSRPIANSRWSGASSSTVGPPWSSRVQTHSPFGQRESKLPVMFEARFQSFDDRAERDPGGERLAALRAELKRRGLDGFIVPRADRYQNEYVPPRAERLAWLTGFTGSAGTAIVLADRAAIFVDGRYLVQVREEVDVAAFAVEHLVEHPPAAWIEENLPAGAKLGYSPWLHTVDGAERLSKACAAARRDRAARSALCRRGGRGEARARARGGRQARRRARRLRSAGGVVAVQYSRARRATYASRASLCDSADVWGTYDLCRFAQARQCRARKARSAGDATPAGGFRARSCRARQNGMRGDARSGLVPRRDRVPFHRERRQDRARRRSDRADESGKERCRDRRLARRANSRWRRGDALSRLVRRRSVARETD